MHLDCNVLEEQPHCQDHNAYQDATICCAYRFTTSLVIHCFRAFFPPLAAGTTTRNGVLNAARPKLTKKVLNRIVHTTAQPVPAGIEPAVYQLWVEKRYSERQFSVFDMRIPAKLFQVDSRGMPRSGSGGRGTGAVDSDNL